MDLYYFGARFYYASIGRFLTIDHMADKYPWISPYAYCFNNPLKYTDVTGDTVDIDPKLLEPVKKKSINDMTAIEKHRYWFQKWWNENKEKVNELFSIGGKYENTNIKFKIGIYPDPLSLIGKPRYHGHTAWGKQREDEKHLYHGEKEIMPDFGIDKLQFIIYFHPKFARNIYYTPKHEWDHVLIIFDAVLNNRVVPSASEQHDMMKRGEIPNY